MENTVKVERINGAALPAYKTPGSVGMDLIANNPEPIVLAPNHRALIPTGLRLAIPNHLEGQIRPRSGIALNNGVTVLNSPGTIDSDYRGEVKVLLINLGTEDFVVSKGERIAQIIFAPICRATLVEAKIDDETERGAGGFGHTGRH